MRRSPLLGYNHNVRCGNVVYHVQTEDSGPKNPHVITHIYSEGTILATRRFDYQAEDPEEKVLEQMQRQHKEMLLQASHGMTPPSPTPSMPPALAFFSTHWQPTAEGIVFYP